MNDFIKLDALDDALGGVSPSVQPPVSSGEPDPKPTITADSSKCYSSVCKLTVDDSGEIGTVSFKIKFTGLDSKDIMNPTQENILNFFTHPNYTIEYTNPNNKPGWVPLPGNPLPSGLKIVSFTGGTFPNEGVKCSDTPVIPNPNKPGSPTTDKPEFIVLDFSIDGCEKFPQDDNKKEIKKTIFGSSDSIKATINELIKDLITLNELDPKTKNPKLAGYTNEYIPETNTFGRDASDGQIFIVPKGQKIDLTTPNDFDNQYQVIWKNGAYFITTDNKKLKLENNLELDIVWRFEFGIKVIFERSVTGQFACNDDTTQEQKLSGSSEYPSIVKFIARNTIKFTNKNKDGQIDNTVKEFKDKYKIDTLYPIAEVCTNKNESGEHPKDCTVCAGSGFKNTSLVSPFLQLGDPDAFQCVNGVIEYKKGEGFKFVNNYPSLVASVKRLIQKIIEAKKTCCCLNDLDVSLTPTVTFVSIKQLKKTKK